MGKPQSREQRRAAYLSEAEQAFDELEGWYASHPQASLGELEAKAREVRQGLMGKVLSILVNERAHAAEVVPPACPQCGQAMKRMGQRAKRVQGLEGVMVVKRAYYVCPAGCGATLFPPGRAVAAQA